SKRLGSCGKPNRYQWLLAVAFLWVGFKSAVTETGAVVGLNGVVYTISFTFILVVLLVDY
ncbi:hypothetical protein, partial [Pectobacterium versatile]|uniref:hypothetical protein n=1 Tax=Pectobacterium versatile TaxID=2488639 RepID=UPI001C6E3EA6